MSFGERRFTAEQASTIDDLPKLHFAGILLTGLAVSSDPDAPSYLNGVILDPVSSPEFEVVDPIGGWIKNNSSKTLDMAGIVTYQVAKGAGGAGELLLWSERSLDDGATFTENPFSLRTSEIGNNTDNSQSKSSGVRGWAPGESMRWAMYNAGAGAVTLNRPSATVNNGNVVEGVPFFWELKEL
ncbi:hypothetical protein [Vibrio phage LP.1]|nr:hypothetical protein [Vibrio phage LP.1]